MWEELVELIARMNGTDTDGDGQGDLWGLCSYINIKGVCIHTHAHTHIHTHAHARAHAHRHRHRQTVHAHAHAHTQPQLCVTQGWGMGL